jgi:hypothetical protein
MVRRVLLLTGWFVGLAAVLAALHAAGSGPLAAPPLRTPGAWAGWAAERTPPEAAVAVLRLVAIALGWYLLAATALGVVARLAGGARSVELADLVALPLVRSVVHAGLGVGLVGTVVATANAGTAAAPLRQPTAADVALSLPATTVPATEPAAVTGAAAEPVIDLRLPEASGPVADVAEPAARTWVIQPGDHLWSVADRVLTDAFGRPPHEREVLVYWKALIERNRHLLPDPDLVHAGLTIELPEVVASRG